MTGFSNPKQAAESASAVLGSCSKGGHNCGKLDCAWGCAWTPVPTVPTGGVPRVSQFAKDNNTRAALNVLLDLPIQMYEQPADPAAEQDKIDAARWRQCIADMRRKYNDYVADTFTYGVDLALKEGQKR